MERNIRISDYDYPLPEGRIAKFPLERREQSKLLVCRDGRIAGFCPRVRCSYSTTRK